MSLLLQKIVAISNTILHDFSANWVAYLTILSVVGLPLMLYYERKHAIEKDIIAILRRCRECPEWDDYKSESKLGEWMLDVTEDKLHNCGLWKLRKVRQGVSAYLYLHLYGRDPIPPPGRLERCLVNLSERLRNRRESRVQQPGHTNRST